MVMGTPGEAPAKETDWMLGPVEFTSKNTLLLGAPPTVTTTLPLVAPPGTGTAIWVLLQLTGVAAVPLKVTVLAPRVAPKLAPLRITMVPATPSPGVKELITGAPVTVNRGLLLCKPAAITATPPWVTPEGTGVTICLSLQLVGVAVMLPKMTLLDPWVVPKSVPVMVTTVPIGPAEGDKALMPGATPKGAELATPPTVTVRV